MTRLTVVENGYLFPNGTIPGRPFTLCDVDGAPVPEAQTTIKHSVALPYYLPKADRAKAGYMCGRHLFGGYYLPHFGHFLLETLSRLWALEDIKAPLDSVVFLHLGRNPPDPTTYADIFNALGVSCPIHILTQPTQFESLYVPQQGLGMGPTATGLPQHRAFLREKLSKLAASVAGHDKVYISRTGYGLKRGGMLAEAALERTLARAGYHLFHPQSEPLGVQIGTYMAASKIVSPDNSALHLFGMVARPDQDVAIVLRRKAGAVDLFPQLSVATGHEPLLIDVIKHVVTHAGRRPANWGHYAELDFRKLYAALIDNGFLPRNAELDLPRWRDMKRELDRMIRRFGGSLSPQLSRETTPDMAAHYF